MKSKMDNNSQWDSIKSSQQGTDLYLFILLKPSFLYL